MAQLAWYWASPDRQLFLHKLRHVPLVASLTALRTHVARQRPSQQQQQQRRHQCLQLPGSLVGERMPQLATQLRSRNRLARLTLGAASLRAGLPCGGGTNSLSGSSCSRTHMHAQLARAEQQLLTAVVVEYAAAVAEVLQLSDSDRAGLGSMVLVQQAGGAGPGVGAGELPAQVAGESTGLAVTSDWELLPQGENAAARDTAGACTDLQQGHAPEEEVQQQLLLPARQRLGHKSVQQTQQRRSKSVLPVLPAHISLKPQPQLQPPIVHKQVRRCNAAEPLHVLPPQQTGRMHPQQLKVSDGSSTIGRTGKVAVPPLLLLQTPPQPAGPCSRPQSHRASRAASATHLVGRQASPAAIPHPLMLVAQSQPGHTRMRPASAAALCITQHGCNAHAAAAGAPLLLQHAPFVHAQQVADYNAALINAPPRPWSAAAVQHRCSSVRASNAPPNEGMQDALRRFRDGCAAQRLQWERALLPLQGCSSHAAGTAKGMCRQQGDNPSINAPQCGAAGNSPGTDDADPSLTMQGHVSAVAPACDAALQGATAAEVGQAPSLLALRAQRCSSGGSTSRAAVLDVLQLQVVPEQGHTAQVIPPTEERTVLALPAATVDTGRQEQKAVDKRGDTVGCTSTTLLMATDKLGDGGGTGTSRASNGDDGAHTCRSDAGKENAGAIVTCCPGAANGDDGAATATECCLHANSLPDVDLVRVVPHVHISLSFNGQEQ